MDNNKIIRFDWAAKRILRQKANFGVLEGLVTVLLGEQVKIVELLESESNQEDASDKFNRVDIKAKNSKGEIIIVEIQLTHEYYFLERILYGVSKAITEHINLGDGYDVVKKVYSINIVYFDLGKGTDYLYHGTTSFKGVHTGDSLQITSRQEGALKMRTSENIFPEYFIIRVNEFNSIANTPLEEWIQYLKTGTINEDTTAPGLQEAREKLQMLSLNAKERAAYERHFLNLMYEDSVIMAYKTEGRAEGIAEGRAEGRAEGIAEGRAEGIAEGRAEGRAEGIAEGRAEVVRNMLAAGMDDALIVQITGMTPAEINALKG